MKLIIALLALLGLASCQPDDIATENLVGTWRAIGLQGNFDVLFAPTDNKITFLEDGSIQIKLDVNTCGATYTHSGTDIDVTANACTEACCDSPFNEQILPILDQVTHIAFSDPDTAVLTVPGSQVMIKLARL